MGVRWSKKAVIWILILVVVVIITSGLLFFNLHHLLVTEDEPQEAEAILVLSGGKGTREVEAARLYHEGYSDTIILTGALVGWQTYTSDLMRAHLLELDVPEETIHAYGPVTSTREEAEQASRVLAELEVETLLLVTSKYHSARAKWIFERTLTGEGIEIISTPIRDDVFDRHWWKEHETRKHGAQEVLKYIWEWLRL